MYFDLGDYIRWGFRGVMAGGSTPTPPKVYINICYIACNLSKYQIWLYFLNPLQS